MNLSAIYSKTGKGARALAAKSKSLSANAVRILSYIDGKTSAEAILPQLGKLPEHKFTEALAQLVNEGYIKEIDADYLTQSLSDFEIHTPIMVAEISAEEFMQIETAAEGINEEAKAREQAEAEARALAYAETQRKLQEEALKQEEAERRLLKVTDILAKSSGSLDIEHLASQEPRQPKTDAEARAKHKARKRAAAEQARRALELAEAAEKAEKLRIEAQKSALEEQARQAQLEQAQQNKLEQDALREAEHKAKAALEAQTRREAEKVALEVQQTAAAKIRRDEENRLQREAENNARIEAERLAHEAKLQAQQEAKALAETQALQQAEARARQAAEKQARSKAEKQAKAERKAQQEAQARDAREARQKLKAEQLARQQAETQLRAQAQAQAKREAEEQARIAAESRALEKARRMEREQAEKALKIEAKRQAKQQAVTQAAARALEKAQLRQARPAKDYFSWLGRTSAVAKRGLLSACVLILLVLVALPFINLGFLIDSMQARLAQTIGEPVAINTLHVAIWPQPHLVLDNVRIGNNADIQAESIRIYPVISSLLAETKTLRAIEIEAIALDENNAQRPVAWFKNASQPGHVKLEHIALHKVALIWQGWTLPIFAMDIELNAMGGMQSAKLKTEDGHLGVEAITSNNGLMLDLAANDWQLPLGSPVVFTELKAKGLLTDKRLQLNEIEGRLYDGTIKAIMNVHWNNGWSGNGKFDVAQIDLAQVMPVFTDSIGMEGKLTANALFSLQADILGQLFEAPSISSHFDSTQGEIKGVDLIRAIQASNKQKVISGTTAFDHFSGNLILENKHYQFRELMLKANQLQAQGEADIFANQEISGKIDIKLATPSRRLQSLIFLTGKLAQPLLK